MLRRPKNPLGHPANAVQKSRNTVVEVKQQMTPSAYNSNESDFFYLKALEKQRD
jgi:hypothetical protein